MPKPHQNTSGAAITAIGTACEPTACGYTARRSHLEKWIATASAKPVSSARPRPSTTSSAVILKFCHSSPALPHSAAAISWGAGSTAGSTPPRSTYTSHAPSTAAASRRGGRGGQLGAS